MVNNPEINKENFTLSEWFFTSRPGLYGLISGWANPTGFLLICILLIMFFCSLPFVRRGGSFEIFYWTHLLYIFFFILVLLHGPNFWKWFSIPGCIFIIERALRFIWNRSDRGKTYVSSGIILPSKVINLVIKRPFHFCYRPGDYVFINIPSIAKYEWHPFTLSSAPEDEDHIGLHIRAVGQWTNRLLDFFQKEQVRLHSGEVKSYKDQVHEHPNAGGKHMEMQSVVNSRSKFEKVNERSDGSNMKQNMIMASEIISVEEMVMMGHAKETRSMSMPDIETKNRIRK